MQIKLSKCWRATSVGSPAKFRRIMREYTTKLMPFAENQGAKVNSKSRPLRIFSFLHSISITGSRAINSISRGRVVVSRSR
jgi:hypothetical protein